MPNKVVIFSKKLCVGSVSDCVKTLINKIPKSAPLACCKKHVYYTTWHDYNRTSRQVELSSAPDSHQLRPRDGTLQLIVYRCFDEARLWVRCPVPLEVTIIFTRHVTRQLDIRLANYSHTCSCCNKSIDPLYSNSKSSEYFFWPRYLQAEVRQARWGSRVGKGTLTTRGDRGGWLTWNTKFCTSDGPHNNFPSLSTPLISPKLAEHRDCTARPCLCCSGNLALLRTRGWY